MKEAANEYTLTEGSTAEYGIDVDATLLKKIPGLAQLERTKLRDRLRTRRLN